MSSLRRITALVACALAPLAAIAASSALGSGASHTVTATERDFAISLPHVIPAGTVDIRVTNRGPDQHELIAVRAAKGALPLRHDGLTVSEEALAKAEVGALEPGKPGETRDLKVILTPGRYVFFCNMSGHFMAGMHTTVVVK
jgi:uncharacterized cupredoxin-like copper-binding protein